MLVLLAHDRRRIVHLAVTATADEHVRDLWQMHHADRPQATLTASLFQTDTGLELRVGFSEDNLLRLQRTADIGSVREIAEAWRQTVIAKGVYRTGTRRDRSNG